MELLLAIVREFNSWLAIAIIGVSGAISLAVVNRSWARASEKQQQDARDIKLYELETERRVKLDRLSVHPGVENGKPMIDSRRSDREE